MTARVVLRETPNNPHQPFQVPEMRPGGCYQTINLVAVGRFA